MYPPTTTKLTFLCFDLEQMSGHFAQPTWGYSLYLDNRVLDNSSFLLIVQNFVSPNGMVCLIVKLFWLIIKDILD